MTYMIDTRTAQTVSAVNITDEILVRLQGLSFSSRAVFRWGEKVEEKVTSDIVVYCSIFRLFVVNIVLP